MKKKQKEAINLNENQFNLAINWLAHLLQKSPNEIKQIIQEMNCNHEQN